MAEQIVDNITGLLVVAIIFFVLINGLMFIVASKDGYWNWESIMTVIIIDIFFILLVCIGIWAIANL